MLWPFWTSGTDGPWDQWARLLGWRIASNTKFVTSVDREAARLLSRGAKRADCRSSYRRDAEYAEKGRLRFNCGLKDAHENSKTNYFANCCCAWSFVFRWRSYGSGSGLCEWN